ncbi:hypothetical protein CALVIDRAFT_568618 [Calocera viscosa TUFC12733]|uniref:Uncharacterized protein n=1 Tax=Calocera viscosa (strain TUFC12733) TaxID=1330018 RepID=A0A167GV64_CALVF|nr:hypothetical protein CALVIDRAFT_568618 [Calocera viscosa TUFC12733]
MSRRSSCTASRTRPRRTSSLVDFHYGLNAVSHPLTRTRLDVKAARILEALVKVVGREVVVRAGDVVEESFSRLEEFHGYSLSYSSRAGPMVVLAKVIAVLGPKELLKSGKSSDVENAPSGSWRRVW